MGNKAPGKSFPAAAGADKLLRRNAFHERSPVIAPASGKMAHDDIHAAARRRRAGILISVS